jgi:ATP-dependent RNA helicase DHX8/PRP22
MDTTEQSKAATTSSPSSSSAAVTRRRLKRKNELQEQRRSLPIFSARSQLIDEIRKHRATVVVGETGSGKTTQLPQYILESWLNRVQPGSAATTAAACHKQKRNKRPRTARECILQVAVTQPRRVAAMSVAARVAEEWGVQLGEEVGYSVRFDDNTSPRTLIKFQTDGMLVREAMLDPLLSKYSVVILDEAHERTVHTDLLFALVKKLLRQRADFRLVIMSATLDATRFSEYFGAKILYVEGRMYPVDVLYTAEPQPDYLDATLITILQLHLEEEDGDALVFLTGREEIESVQLLLEQKLSLLPEGARKLLVRPLYAALPPQEQLKAFDPAPPGARKIILATNIAETSLTINGIR